MTGAATVGQVSSTVPPGNFMAFDTFAPDVYQTDLVWSFDDDLMRRFKFTSGGIFALGNRTLFYDDSSIDGDPVDVHSGADPAIVAMGSTNGIPGARAIVLYGIDSTQNSIAKIDRETGSMDTVAILRAQGGGILQIGARRGFDISGVTGIAYLSIGSGDATALQPVGVNVADISTLPPAPLVNLSTRSRVDGGENVMIAGFITQGGASTRLIIRGIGPSLANAGITNPLFDPVLTVFDGNGIQLATNDNWRSTQETDISQTGVPPGNDLESAFVSAFPPGASTAIVSGKNGASGVGVVEIYRLPDL